MISRRSLGFAAPLGAVPRRNRKLGKLTVLLADYTIG